MQAIKLLPALLLTASITANATTGADVMRLTTWIESCSTIYPADKNFRDAANKMLTIYKRTVSEHGLSVYTIKSIIKFADTVGQNPEALRARCNGYLDQVNKLGV